MSMVWESARVGYAGVCVTVSLQCSLPSVVKGVSVMGVFKGIQLYHRILSLYSVNSFNVVRDTAGVAYAGVLILMHPFTVFTVKSVNVVRDSPGVLTCVSGGSARWDTTPVAL